MEPRGLFQCKYAVLPEGGFLTVSQPSYHSQGISNTGKTASLHQNGPLSPLRFYLNMITSLIQDCTNPIANAVELLQSCAKPLR